MSEKKSTFGVIEGGATRVENTRAASSPRSEITASERSINLKAALADADEKIMRGRVSDFRRIRRLIAAIEDFVANRPVKRSGQLVDDLLSVGSIW